MSTGCREPAREVRAAEIAFAKTMADRDHAGFMSFLSEEAIFVGTSSVLRGRSEVGRGWMRHFEGAVAPFSWTPELVEVLASGTLGLTSGPVLSPAGERIAQFNSVWRLEPGGIWRVVFDRGCPPWEDPS